MKWGTVQQGLRVRFGEHILEIIFPEDLKGIQFIVKRFNLYGVVSNRG